MTSSPSQVLGSRKIHVLTTGHTYSYLFQPSSYPSNQTFLLLHGFPGTSASWHKLATHLTTAGYGVLAPDLLGYGATSKPTAVEEYACSKMSAHVVEILEHEGLERVVGVGHDWGTVLLARMWNYYPQYLSSLVFMCVPYQPPGPMDIDAMNAMTKEAFGYEMGGYWYFLTSSEAAEVLLQNTESFLSIVYQNDAELWKTDFCPSGKLKEWVTQGRIAPLPSWMSKEEFDEISMSFKEGGFTGSLNWYNAALQHVDKSAESSINPSALIIPHPVTFIVGEDDAVGRPEIGFHSAEQGKQKGYLPDVQVEVVKGAAHWMMMEKPEAVFQILDKVVKRL